MEEFIVPISRDELSNRSSSNQYCVSKKVSVSSISNHISVCEQEFQDRGHVFIYKMFDYFYSVLHHWNSIDVKIKEKTWDILLKSCKKSIPVIMETNNVNISFDEQFMYRNSVKMNIYLLCQMIELFTNDIFKPNQLVEKGKGRKKQTTSQVDVISEIETVLNVMNQLFQCKINKFWEPPVVEEDFVNLICNTCYKLLENPEIFKIAAIRDGITKVLINMIKNYSHNLSCSVKLVQLLHSSSHMPPHLLYICRSFINAENINNIICDILTEICSYSSIDLERNNLAAVSFSTFLTDFAKEFPKHIVAVLPELKDKLDEDPVSIRIGVLTIFSEVIIQVYSLKDESVTNRDSLISIIEDHVIDVNGFVRAKALSILLTIIEKCDLPLQRLAKIMKLLVGEEGAIMDTSSNARKNAIRIITFVASMNISHGLSSEDLKERLEAEKLALLELGNQIAEMPITDEIADVEKQIEMMKTNLENENENKEPSESTPIESHSVAKEMLEKKLTELKGFIYVIGQMMEITLCIETGVTNISGMLSSRVASDVLEAISFFVNAKKSNILNVDMGIRSMLPHICSKDESVKNAVTKAYKTLYLEIEDEEGDQIQLIVDSLSKLVINPKYGELICIEKLIVNFTESNDVSSDVIKCLWDRFTSKPDSYSALQKKCAVIIFSMVANVDKPFMVKYFNSLINEIIPSTGFESVDLQLIEHICITIQNMIKSRKITKLAEVYRLSRQHILFERLINISMNTFTLEYKKHWITMTNEAISTIYLLAENPNIISSRFISSLSNKIFVTYENHLGNFNDNSLKCQPFMLMRYIDVVGHVAMKQFIHFDVAILTELKRRNTIKEEKDLAQKTKKMAKDAKHKSQNGEKNLEEEMGLVGATADDAEAEFIRKLCENELITDPSKLLNRLLNLVVHVCSNVSQYKNKELQKIASLSLGKMMLISSNVCMDNIDLLFNLASRSPSEIIRANLIVPLGDLIKRFTTKLEPYTPSLYGRLRDNSPIVRLNALNVLSHLILNDMIKVKGQISEMTTCIIDSNPRIVHLSKIFFQELATKDKALYNVMPDIISRLSNPLTGVSEEQFRTILEYLIPFIQKKNQSENLFEKICSRFQAANDERSWRDLSFCLSLMPFNETMLRALQFNLSSFAGKLHVDEVYNAINSILNNAKKTAKGEMVAVIEEMSVVIMKLRELGVEDEEANMDAKMVAAKKKRKSKKQRDTIVCKDVPSSSQKSTRSRANKVIEKYDEDKSSDENNVDDNKSIASSRPTRSCNVVEKRRIVKDIFSDDSAESDEENTKLKNERKTVKPPTSKRNLITEDSSESEDSN